MAATASPILVNDGANVSAPTPIHIVLSATPNTVTEMHLPQNAKRLALQITTVTGGHDIDIGFASGGETVNIAVPSVWLCPVELVASQKIYFSSTHADANFDVLIGLRP